MSDTQTSTLDENEQNNEQERAVATLAAAFDSPPRGSSLLLCPSQWSALLEAAPVALVVRETRDGTTLTEDPKEPDFECEPESEAEEKDGEQIPRLVFAEDDEIRTPLGGQTPDPDRYVVLGP